MYLLQHHQVHCGDYCQIGKSQNTKGRSKNVNLFGCILQNLCILFYVQMVSGLFI